MEITTGHPELPSPSCGAFPKTSAAIFGALAFLPPGSLSTLCAADTPVTPAKLPTTNEEIRRAAANAPLQMLFRGRTADDLAAWQREFSAKLRERIGPHEPPGKWQARTLSQVELPDHTREELLLESEGTPSLPLYVLRPKGAAGKRLPIVLCLHGHGESGHDAVAGVDDTPELQREIRQFNYDYGRQLAREGYLAVIPCFTPFGRRLDARPPAKTSDPCAVAFVRLMFLGRTLLGENLRDAKWALDYATTRPDARADRIGCVGLSYGGRMTMVVSALDPRVRVAVISGALNVFQERIQGAGYSCGAQVIPGLLEFGDTPEIGSLIAPRPAIWEAGRQDALMVPGWLEKAAGRLQAAYAAAGQPENFQVHRFEGGHVWNGETAIPLLARVLKEP
ncbi:MAG: dienelactone hydrolase family protein [Verrucomicrobia bacterium]|nr:dienelactone hydrolase family protein [Verrucomicrobiota bacterium]